MKKAVRDHFYAYGRTRGFLTTHAHLSEGGKGPAVQEDLDLYCSDFCGCSTSPCEHYQLFLAGWKEGVAQAELVYTRQDLDLVEDLGRAAGLTRYSSSPQLFLGLSLARRSGSQTTWRSFPTICQRMAANGCGPTTFQRAV